MKNEYVSCIHLREHLLFGQEFLGFCCNMPPKHWFQAVSRYWGEPFPEAEFAEQRRRMEDALNEGKPCTCRDCPNLETRAWAEPRAFITQINFGHTYACNLRCLYCYYRREGRLDLGKPYYAVTPVVRDMYDRDLIAPDAEMCLASGEPLIMKGVDDLFDLILARSRTRLEVRSNLSVFSRPFAEMLRRDRARLCFSLDCGTRKTFKLVKGRDLFAKVTENLGRYAAVNPDAIEFKYICLPENANPADREGALLLMRRNRLTRLHLTPNHLSPPDGTVLEFMGEFAALAEAEGHRVHIDYETAERMYPNLKVRERVESAKRRPASSPAPTEKKTWCGRGKSWLRKFSARMSRSVGKRVRKIARECDKFHDVFGKGGGQPASSGSKRYFCRHLQGHLVFAVNSISPCCGIPEHQFPLMSDFAGDAVPDAAIAQARKRRQDALDSGRDASCRGCAYLHERREDDKIPEYFCDMLNFGNYLGCNLRCNFCNYANWGLLDSPAKTYGAVPILRDLYDRNLLSPDAEICLASGEPFLMPRVEDFIEMVLRRGRSLLEIRSNLTVFSPAAAEALAAKRLKICFSLDSGTPETFRRIKRRDLFGRVAENAARYGKINPGALQLKYICLPENMNKADMLGALRVAREAGIRDVILSVDIHNAPTREAAGFMAGFIREGERAGVAPRVDYSLAAGAFPDLDLRGMVDAAMKKG
jgi:MoaA/NifB/PqqE/SkfB family radical SAM enzyme